MGTPPNPPPGIFVSLSRAGASIVRNPVHVALPSAHFEHLKKTFSALEIDVAGENWEANDVLNAELENWPHSAPGARTSLGVFRCDPNGSFSESLYFTYEEPTPADDAILGNFTDLKIEGKSSSGAVTLKVQNFWFFP